MEDTPFSSEYVFRITMKHIIRSIDTSIKKTHARLADKPEQATEILNTISGLMNLKNSMEEIVKNNQFGDE